MITMQDITEAGKKRVNYYLPKPLIRKVRLRAAHEEREMSAIVAEALILYFEQNPEAA